MFFLLKFSYFQPFQAILTIVFFFMKYLIQVSFLFLLKLGVLSPKYSYPCKNVYKGCRFILWFSFFWYKKTDQYPLLPKKH